MFVELLPLLRNRTVSLSVAVPANGDSIVLTIMPKVTDEKAEEFGSIKEAAVKALSGALTLKAQSAEELDAGLHQALLQYVGSQLTIEGSINEMVKTVKAAEEEAKEAAKAAVAAAKKKSGQAASPSKPSAAAATAAPAEEKRPEPPAPPSLFDAAPAEENEASAEATDVSAGLAPTPAAPSPEVGAA
jgi:PRTRC genetic system protein E